MVDLVTTTIYENGPRRAVIGFTNLSDGTGESAVVKVNATSSGSLGFQSGAGGQLVYPGIHLVVVGIWYNVQSMKLRLLWDANTDTDFAILGGQDHWRFLDKRGGFMGMKNPNNTGATGNILFTTVGANLNASYTVVLEMTKNMGS